MCEDTHVIRRCPTVDEYLALRAAMGWQIPAASDAERALAATLAGAVAVAGTNTVGMGRVVGDGTFYCFVVDLVVDPSCQGHGIGSRILRSLEDSVADVAARPVTLIAAPDVAGFYRQLGYEDTHSVVLTRSADDQPVARNP